jgi:hypothetical protein
VAQLATWPLEVMTVTGRLIPRAFWLLMSIKGNPNLFTSLRSTDRMRQ